ncbi:hypothetical protein BURCENBC7_AP7395 [Burkholderia cenocepacia BC7]|nr:hypothetical protein BURCENBC7_AP7395 [Burkholderia cenocepacia BC7]
MSVDGPAQQNFRIVRSFLVIRNIAALHPYFGALRHVASEQNRFRSTYPV